MLSISRSNLVRHSNCLKNSSWIDWTGPPSVSLFKYLKMWGSICFLAIFSRNYLILASFEMLLLKFKSKFPIRSSTFNDVESPRSSTAIRLYENRYRKWKACWIEVLNHAETAWCRSNRKKVNLKDFLFYSICWCIKRTRSNGKAFMISRVSNC